ncbi:MAG: hypothetical protein JXJ04_26325 [Spirochaetales bacterium]|nr:hypothetical protein [Spirochaetales bacterium]
MKTVFFCILVSAILLNSCFISDLDGYEEDPTSMVPAEYSGEPLARIDLDNNEFIEYYETGQGEFLMWSVLNSKEKLELLENKNPLEVYEVLTHNKPSNELAKAFKDSAPSYSDVPEDYSIIFTEPPADPELSKMSAEDFKAEYYDPHAGFWFAADFWGNRTGSCHYGRTCAEIVSYAHPYRGTITHKIKWKNFVNKTKSKSYTIYEGQVSRVYSRYNYQRYREASVYNADGDGYHFFYWATK